MGAILKIDQDYAIGGQPNHKQLHELALQGYGSVVNLRQEGEDEHPFTPKEEGVEVLSFDMEYAHLPFSYRELTLEKVQEYCQKIGHLPKPVYVHCQAGRRAGVMLAIYYAHKHGRTYEEMVPLLGKFGLENEGADLRTFIKEKIDGHRLRNGEK